MPVRKIYKWGYDKKTKPAKPISLDSTTYMLNILDPTSDNGKSRFLNLTENEVLLIFTFRDEETMHEH